MHRLLDDPLIARFEPELGRTRVKHLIGEELARYRSGGAEPAPEYPAILRAAVSVLEAARFEGLVRAVNGTGILLHTNLGRAPIGETAFEAMRDAAGGYSNLEYDLVSGRRGSRYARASALLCDLTGAQDALVVNNCAAAVLLVLDTFARAGREVVVSRGELIEIGGGFRIPDVLERSGATLVEVGATNKTYLADYERALTPKTALLLRTHPSNYRITGFTHAVGGDELVGLGRRAGIAVVEDLGSGALVDLRAYGLPRERTVQEAVADGIDLVCFSGDKLLGGPQAGVVVGASAYIARLRANPLLRALRVDKLTIAALARTLRSYASGALSEIPLYAMLGATLEVLRARAGRYAREAGTSTVETAAYLGGGSLPEDALPSIGVRLPHANASAVAARMRRSNPPIVGRIDEGRYILDLRTIAADDDDAVIRVLNGLRD